MKRFLIPILISIPLTIVSFLLAGLASGACHCDTPLPFFFPYVVILGKHADSGVLALALFCLQFPVYAISAAMANGPNWKARIIGIILAVHLAAALLAVGVSR